MRNQKSDKDNKKQFIYIKLKRPEKQGNELNKVKSRSQDLENLHVQKKSNLLSVQSKNTGVVWQDKDLVALQGNLNFWQ